MNNPNNPRGQQDDLQKKPGKPMDGHMGQKAQQKGDKENLSHDMDKDKSNDMKKGGKADQGQMGPDKRQH